MAAITPRVAGMLERFQAEAVGAGRVVGAWAPALLVLWCYGLEQKALDFREVKEQRAVVKKRTMLVDNRAALVSDDRLVAVLKEEQRQLCAIRARASVAFKLPGFDVSVPSVWAPTLW